MGGTSRMTGDSHVRICEGLGVKLPRPTRLQRMDAPPSIWILLSSLPKSEFFSSLLVLQRIFYRRSRSNASRFFRCERYAM
jgi:hypothetical protein